ncbi:MAG: hypothetical protein GVY26_02885 [Bacteroidetes bacterium]|nr:hypothetical protein [Bacteroidota bacterium]
MIASDGKTAPKKTNVSPEAMVYGYPSLLHLYLSLFYRPVFSNRILKQLLNERANPHDERTLQRLDMIFFKLSLCLLEKKPYLSVVLSSLPKLVGTGFGAKAIKISYPIICCSSFGASFGEDGASLALAASHCRKAKSTLVD